MVFHSTCVLQLEKDFTQDFQNLKFISKYGSDNGKEMWKSLRPIAVCSCGLSVTGLHEHGGGSVSERSRLAPVTSPKKGKEGAKRGGNGLKNEK